MDSDCAFEIEGGTRRVDRYARYGSSALLSGAGQQHLTPEWYRVALELCPPGGDRITDRPGKVRAQADHARDHTNILSGVVKGKGTGSSRRLGYKTL